ncbi:hypothetical protein AGMMS50230_19330 [Spirochaetia bacterium]|nr:hypothetical protein AGMMS50230_19330 [Spirochaetia bacterium]
MRERERERERERVQFSCQVTGFLINLMLIYEKRYVKGFSLLGGQIRVILLGNVSARGINANLEEEPRPLPSVGEICSSFIRRGVEYPVLQAKLDLEN